jgi:deoxyribose-phosphate aldolase
MTCCVVGFPLGAMSREAKAAEAFMAIDAGADELDMVISVGDLKGGSLRAVLDDIRGVVVAARGRPVKVIIETCLLDDVEKAVACLLAVRAGAAYVKTSTGMSTGGATAADVALMRAVVGDELGVKASGGIRSTADALAMLEAGADRIGASASIAIASGGGEGATGY